MWSQLLLCALVGFAAASDFGWKSGTEYTYKVRGRTFTAIHDVADQYSGILLKASLQVYPQENGKLIAKLQNTQYSKVHAYLKEGWLGDIPSSEVRFQPLPISEEPFEIVMKNGVVRDLIVSQNIQAWESNLLKSVVSQIQLDTQGENVISSHLNQLPEKDSNSAVFKTLEDTITGKYETLYDISPIPEFVLQSQPWLAPMPHLKQNGEFIEIVKSKNFSRGEERVSYHFGLGSNDDVDPSSNQMGDFFLRSSVSRAVISGDLKHYTIQSSATTNKIILSPTLNSEEKGMVVSYLNLTLANVESASGSAPSVQQPQHLGNLVYSYQPGSESGRTHYRNRRSTSSEETYQSAESQDYWTLEQQKLTDAPKSPFLPMAIGYKGKSVKSAQNVDIVNAVEKIAKQVGEEIQHPETIVKEQTLAKFTILTRLIRAMNEKEIKHATQKLYSKEEQGVKADTWKAYRDAVAECGTGPALLAVQELIENKQIRGEEAAEVIATMTQAVRHPTEEYMRRFYSLVTKDQVQSQGILNDTAIISYSTLIRKVYIDKDVSHNQYPVQTFGSFRHSEGAKELVHQQFIPYLKQQLHQAIKDADSHKALVYIRCLGNVAHQSILSAFKPYLEGDKQCSQFQRLQMVVALDKLAYVHPKIAHSVLYKIYQNSGEMQEIRVAAVHQLMRTYPAASTLQRMAQYTNRDTAEQVNAVVKSAIETCSQLEGESFTEFAENCRAAEPLLTKDTYGVQYSKNYLRSYVQDEMNLIYKQNYLSIGSQDSIIPQGIKYSLRAAFGGIRREIAAVQFMFSSIDELTNVLARQTEYHQKKLQQQRDNLGQAQQNQFSSESIAKLLNIKSEEREQLEGSLYMQLAGGASRLYTINNQTIELLPHVLREIEEALRQGQEVSYTKFLNRDGITISFPTEMSLPFYYTLDEPTVMRLEATIRASAEPQISSGDKLRAPQTVSGKAEVRACLSTKIEAKLGFVTPFDHQEYISGYDKNMQVYVPVKAQLELDTNAKELQIQIQPLKQDKNVEIFHYSTWPYTATKDILEFEPVANTQDSRVINTNYDGPKTQFETVIGKKSGIAFKIEYSSEQQFMDAKWLYDQYQRHDAISALMAPFSDETIQHSKVKVDYYAQESTANRVLLRLNYDHSEETGEGQSESVNFANLPRDSKARKERMIKMASSGIKYAKCHAVEASVELDGQNKVEYVATAAVARSHVDEQGRLLIQLQKHANSQKSYQVTLKAEARVPETNEMDFIKALKYDPTIISKAEITFGEDQQSATKINFNAKFEQSESRRRYLQSSPRGEECRRELQHHNKQMPACANLTDEANLLDRVQVHIKYDNLSPLAQNISRKIYNAISYAAYFNLDEDYHGSSQVAKSGEVNMLARFEPTLESVNVSVSAPNFESHFDNIRINEYVKQLVVVHPAHNAYAKVLSEAQGYDSYHPICVVDQTYANTFDNKTYPVEHLKSWTVMMQYVPDFARKAHQEMTYQQMQEKYQIEQHSVLVREAGNGKEVKITIRTPETQGQLIEIDLKSGSGNSAQVFVDQQQQEVDEHKTIQLKHGYINIHGLPHGEVKVEVYGSYEVIYDGERVKIAAKHDKFRDALRGLCGTFNGEQTDDFTAPKNCILRDASDFVASWTVEGGEHEQHPKYQCVYKDIIYTNVVSEHDAGHVQENYRGSNSHSRHSSGSQGCSKHQTRYVDDDGSICFTLRPVPSCKSSCTASRYMKKNVSVHCVSKGSQADQFVNQIKKGASPDFTNKSETKTLSIQVPESCSRY